MKQVTIDTAARVRATMTPVLLNIYLLEKGLESDSGLQSSLASIRASVEHLLEEVEGKEAETQTRTT